MKKTIILTLIIMVFILGGCVSSDPKVKARDARRISDIKIMQTSLKMYYSDQKKFPISAEGVILGQGEYGCLDMDGFSAEPCDGKNVYNNNVPADPGSGKYVYKSLDGKDYSITFSIEGGEIVGYEGDDCVANDSEIECN